MDKPIKRIVIVGAGSAGWITAGILAADHCTSALSEIEVVLIESPNVATIGVGEGTWPSMRSTLERIGINELEFLSKCDASFKQGSKFVNWKNLSSSDFYYHPFMTPDGYGQLDLHGAWQSYYKKYSFADAINIQSHVCEAGLAPKQQGTPAYAAVTNYGYHLDASKFAQLLQEHCTSKLNVEHILAHVDNIITDENGDISAIKTTDHGTVEGDLFIDCTGQQSLLLGKHYKVDVISQKHILFNDSALALHVPYNNENDPIASATISTAQTAGWIWDIGLQSRRGVGYTYSSQHISDEQATQELLAYVGKSESAKIGEGQQSAEALVPKKLSFTPGYKEKFWHKNCVAIGMSAGFIEPLEASALAMVELSVNMLTDELPRTRKHMDIVSKRFNARFTYRWQRVIDFLKLHYVLSDRKDSQYWLDNKHPDSMSESLQEMLELWQFQTPSRYDLVQNEEIFPSASYQYVLYGMGFNTQQSAHRQPTKASKFAVQAIEAVQGKVHQYLSGLPKNRVLLNALKEL